MRVLFGSRKTVMRDVSRRHCASTLTRICAPHKKRRGAASLRVLGAGGGDGKPCSNAMRTTCCWPECVAECVVCLCQRKHVHSQRTAPWST